jgi:phage terminase large subunit
MSDVRLSDIIAPTYQPVHNAIKNHAVAEVWLKGGRGSAKSSFLAIELVLELLRHPDAHAIVYRRVANTLRESVYEQLIRAVSWLKLDGYFEYRLSPLEIRYRPTGQRILFRGADDPAKSKSIALRSGYFGVIWFEELAEFRDMDAIRTIRASVIRGGHETLTFYSYNPPKSMQSWVNRESIVPVEKRLIHHSSYLDIPAKWLGEDFIREANALKKNNERAYRHMYLGEATGTGGNVFDNLQLRALTPQEQDCPTTYCGLDFGFAVDPDAFVRWAYEPRTRKLIALEEFYGVKNSVDRLSAEVKKRAGRDVVRCDSADPRMISELNERNVNALGVKKGPGSVEHGMRWLTDQGTIVIDPKRTPNIAREFAAYEYEMDKNGAFVAEYPDRDNHAIDATRYALEPMIGKKKLQTMSKSRLGL